MPGLRLCAMAQGLWHCKWCLHQAFHRRTVHPLLRCAPGESLPALEQLATLPQGLLFAIPTVIGFCETARSQRWTGNEVIRNVLPRSEDGRYLGTSGVGDQGLDPEDVGYFPGDVGFDPLGLLPADPAELRSMQQKELAHSRLAMLAAAGFVAQEAATGVTWPAAVFI